MGGTLAAAMAQRLVRVVCQECKEEYEPDRSRLPADFKLAPGARLVRGVGCRKCRGTGFRGRTGVFELMMADDPIRERIMARAAVGDVTHAALKAGMRMLREDGWMKVRAGITTPEEVMRSTKV